MRKTTRRVEGRRIVIVIFAFADRRPGARVARADGAAVPVMPRLDRGIQGKELQGRTG